MKLGTLPASGRDGRLVVVSRDLAWCADAGHIAPTLQAALDDWERLAPQLELLATALDHGGGPRDRLLAREGLAPLPRAPSRPAPPPRRAARAPRGPALITGPTSPPMSPASRCAERPAARRCRRA